MISKVRVIPNEQALTNAKGRVSKSELAVNNAKTVYNRNKKLYDNGVIAIKELEVFQLNYDQSKQDLINAQNDYQIIKKGFTGQGGSANTNMRATASGMILEIPVKKGYQVKPSISEE